MPHSYECPFCDTKITTAADSDDAIPALAKKMQDHIQNRHPEAADAIDRDEIEEMIEEDRE